LSSSVRAVFVQGVATTDDGGQVHGEIEMGLLESRREVVRKGRDQDG
jgi:hypothetical protein